MGIKIKIFNNNLTIHKRERERERAYFHYMTDYKKQNRRIFYCHLLLSNRTSRNQRKEDYELRNASNFQLTNFQCFLPQTNALLNCSR